MIENLAPEIVRKRLLIEGFYETDVTKETIESYFNTITKTLSLRMYGKPIIFSPEGMGKGDNQGFDAFVPLIDSGISIYVWSEKKFLSGIIYTCKDFDEALALSGTKDFFQMKKVASASF